MQKIIKRIILLIVSILLLNSLFFNYYVEAAEVTKQSLTTALQNFTSSPDNESDYKIDVLDKTIKVTVEGEDYILNYDLTEKPTFTLEIPIEKGMSYEDFRKQTDNIMLPMLGYIAVANIQNVDFKNASSYFLMSSIENFSGGEMSTENAYMIVDDMNMANGVTANKDESKKNVIYTSEFGERVMEYVNNIYKDKQDIKDISDGINSYEWITERRDVTDTSCKLVSSVSVNLDADFSKLNNYSEQLTDSFLDKSITKENADYAITLKVGQKCRFEADEKITSHQISGSGYEFKEIDENTAEITGKSVGRANGYINVGTTKKSFFITVEENTGNAKLDTLTYKINTKSGTSNPSGSSAQPEQKPTTNTNIQNTNTKNTVEKDNTSAKVFLPQTGSSNIIFIIVLGVLVLLVALFIKLKKYEDIK